jgi:hypothetical protein
MSDPMHILERIGQRVLPDDLRHDLALVAKEVRALEARLKDRNEGECYGPFHAGFVCEDCANRTRALQKAEAAKDEAVVRLAESLERWPSVLEDKRKAEAELLATAFARDAAIDAGLQAEADLAEARKRIDALRRQAKKMADVNQSGDYCAADRALGAIADSPFTEPFYFPQNAQERAAGRESGVTGAPVDPGTKADTAPAPNSAAAKSAARFQDELREAIEREARDG